MCGQVGVILGKKRRSASELEALGRVFTHMLLLCERRGRYATGIAMMKADGHIHLFKRPLPAGKFIFEPMYQAILSDLDKDTTLLMGHNRFPTTGSSSDNCNNHPIRAGIIVGTHNGTIYNADYLFKKFRMKRFAKVDSEIIFRLADRFSTDGHINLPTLLEKLARCRGQMSTVLASQFDPGTVMILKGNKPLHLFLNRRKKIILYASAPEFVIAALEESKGWREFNIPRMTAITVRCDDLTEFESQTFTFKTQKRRPRKSQGECLWT